MDAQTLALAQKDVDNLVARVDEARRARAAADEAYRRLPTGASKAMVNASAVRDAARRKLETLEKALGTAKETLAAVQAQQG